MGVRELKETGPPCPICDSEQFRPLFSKDGREFWACASCPYERQWPVPSLRALQDFYDDEYTRGSYRPFIETPGMQEARAQVRFRRIQPFVRQGKWLDVGAAQGDFVHVARVHGNDGEGIELSPVAVARGLEMGRPVRISTVEDLEPSRPFDVVTAFDVIEHTQDPTGFLERIRDLLMPDGVLVLSLPNAGSPWHRVMGSRWFFYLPDQHLHYFTRSGIKALLHKTGFDTVRMRSVGKYVSYEYGATQLGASNPALAWVTDVVGRVIPTTWRQALLPLYLGEMEVIARRAS